MIDVEVLHIADCPSHAAYLPRLHELLASTSLPVRLRVTQVGDETDAVARQFVGSPTVRVDGLDVDASAVQRGTYGLQCRLYPTEQGLLTAPPDPWVLHALHEARSRPR